MGSISQASSSPQFLPHSPGFKTTLSLVLQLEIRAFSLPALLHTFCDRFCSGTGDRTNRKKQGDSSPAHTPFKPQFFWSDKRIPLRALGAFPASTVTATSAAQFQLQYEACPGTGLYEKRTTKKEISLTLSVLKRPSFLLLRPERQGCSWNSFFPCLLHSSRIHAASETRPADTGAKSKTGDRHQIVYTPSSGSLSQSTCYHFFFRVLRELLPAFCPGFLFAFSGRTDYVYSILVRTGTLRNVFLKLHTHLWKKENKYGPSTILSSSSNQVNT